ncbi:hypothetical protein D3C85_1363610 [compost metagenome]
MIDHSRNVEEQIFEIGFELTVFRFHFHGELNLPCCFAYAIKTVAGVVKHPIPYQHSILGILILNYRFR